MVAKVFIDGDVGTTGLEIRARLAGRMDIALLRLDETNRKDPKARAAMLAEADVAILCLPDDAAREAVALAGEGTRFIDASTAHRTAPGWVYGFPEMDKDQRAAIASARLVSNPGCYPTGMIALTRPLVKAGLLPTDWPLTVNAVSGYSGGGKSLITAFEDEAAPSYTKEPFRTYGLNLAHKHVEEMRVHGLLSHRPLFAPSVGRFYRGMLVEVPLQLWALPGAPKASALHAALSDAFRGERFVSVVPLDEAAKMTGLDPEGQNNTNGLKLFVFANEDAQQARLVAQLDNLGKGASGAAVQNLNIMLGLDEAAGL